MALCYYLYFHTQEGVSLNFLLPSEKTKSNFWGFVLDLNNSNLALWMLPTQLLHYTVAGVFYQTYY